MQLARALVLVFACLATHLSPAHAQEIISTSPTVLTVNEQENSSCSAEWMTKNITNGHGIWYMGPAGTSALFQVTDFITPVLVKAPSVGATYYKAVGFSSYQLLPKGSTPVWTTGAQYFCSGFEPRVIGPDPVFTPPTRLPRTGGGPAPVQLPREEPSK